MLGVRKRVKRMVRAVEQVGSTPSSRRASDDDVGGVVHNSQGGVLAIFESQQRQRSFNSPRPLPLTGGGSGPLLLGGGSNGGGQPPSPAGRGSGRGSGAKGEGGCSGRGSGRSDDTRGLSSQLNSSRDAQNSSGDDTSGLPLSRLHSYSKMRPVIGGEAAAVSPFPTAAGGGVCLAPSTSGPLGLRPPSFSSGAPGIRPPSFTSGRPASFSSRGKASELAVLAGLRQASLGRGGFGAVMAGDSKPLSQPNLPTMKEGSFGGAAAVSEFYSSQQSKQGSAPPPRPHRQQNTGVKLDQLSGEEWMRCVLCVGTGGPLMRSLLSKLSVYIPASDIVALFIASSIHW